MPKTIAILGGGVAGLSAAHELAERGFQVTVYEKKLDFGGKARSLSKAGTGTGGRKDLPGEHGFRFFPSFYTHLPDTMERIPGADGSPVSSHLVAAQRSMLARAGMPPILLPTKVPTKPEDWALAVRLLFSGIGVPDGEVLFFTSLMLKIATSCQERRETEFERISWWDFIQAKQHSHAYQTLLGQGLTRSLVAMRAEEGSTRTIGNIILQLLNGIFAPTGFDRLLNGPTSDVWLTPWVKYLAEQGVKFARGFSVREFRATAAGVSSVVLVQGNLESEIMADYYVSALPVEVMGALIGGSLLQSAPSLQLVKELSTNIRWMNGIQFFLKEDVPLNPGHTSYTDSPWALTSISQKQFWEDAPMSDYGDGNLGGILSIDISDWDAPGVLFGKPARQCTAVEIKDEVWAQLKMHLNGFGAPVIEDGNLLDWYLDPDIEFPNPSVATNAEPLLINRTGTLKLRPDAATTLPNLFLASDYVRTNTDLACMEGANEAARRAVNAILDQEGSAARRADIFGFSEPEIFKPVIEFDRMRFRLGL